MSKVMEKRAILTNVEIRSGDEGGLPTIEGYALKFNRNSEKLGYWSPFIERLDQNCLDKTDMSNVVALVNHDENMTLARTGINLSLEVDNIGLKFKFTPTDTSYARDLIANMQAGVINKCSFAFTIPDDDTAETWEKLEEGTYLRTIHHIDKVYDISVVTNPAYEDTEAVVGQRGRHKIERLLIDDKDELEEREKLNLQIELYR
ncbi:MULTISPECIES: HK97 family phage prohead protease [unclassified Granulicatella]|uniref:HK97 family phage prohead protease n=1 Tax=unclassified Granulicatella TaxID=2630493 RepID=UPI001073B279|nr:MULTISPECIES: HK97 family phage prohead protease [unclassified Granulicatella]MBF0780507.1 HK97 family phage prohead protease [Granulicatella sp. 19428wC4_WM01]TFU95322.1 HK97 family phage prohead protease [Granulicatella sp. WM01]